MRGGGQAPFALGGDRGLSACENGRKKGSLRGYDWAKKVKGREPPLLRSHRRLVAQVLHLFAQDFEVYGDIFVIAVEVHVGADA